MNRKVITLDELAELQKLEKFAQPDETPLRVMCGTCKSDRNTIDKKTCHLCGALLANGYRHAGTLKGVDLYVKVGEKVAVADTVESNADKKHWRK